MGFCNAYLVLEVRPPIRGDGIAALNVGAVFLGASGRRITSLSVKPFLNTTLNARNGYLGKLIFEAWIIGQEDASLPLPDTLFSRWYAGADRCTGTKKQRVRRRTFDSNRPHECTKREAQLLPLLG